MTQEQNDARKTFYLLAGKGDCPKVRDLKCLGINIKDRKLQGKYIQLNEMTYKRYAKNSKHILL